MGLLEDMGKGVRAEVTAGALMIAGLVSGCAQSKPQWYGASAVDSRVAATSTDTFDALKLPSIRNDRTELQIASREFSKISLDGVKGYVLDIPKNTFLEVENLGTGAKKAVLSQQQVFKTDDAFVFDVPTDQLGRYNVTLLSYRFCNQGAWGALDGTYFCLVDMGRDREIVSAVKLPIFGELQVTRNLSDPSAVNGLDGLVYLRTSDGTVHRVPKITQLYQDARHTTPTHIKYIHNKISPLQSADDLKGKE